MRKVQILMPMGGLGNRFVEKGYTTPKALIPVDGKPMFKRALDSFASCDNADYLFVIRRDHEDKYKLSEAILQEIPNAKITILEKNTRGAVETAMLAHSFIDEENPIIVADCDIYFESSEYFQKIQNSLQKGKPDGMLLTFDAKEPRYSYVEIDSNGRAIRTAEKVVISNHAILGGYYFRSGNLFKSLATEFLSQELPEGLKEYFMSHLFNILLQKGGEIEIAKADIMHIFGTPEELQAYFKEHPQS